MATLATKKLTLAEFDEQYEHEKPYYELWHGEPVQKSSAGWIHGLLQRILITLLGKAGYKAASEVKLKIDSDFQPLPDVIATRGRVELPYPTKAVEIVVEILSDDDSMSRILSKCRAYRGWGFAEIYVLDPAARVVFRWTDHKLEEVNTFASLSTERIWSSLDKALG